MYIKPLLCSLRYYCKQRPIKHLSTCPTIYYDLQSKFTWYLSFTQNVFYCKRVFLPESSRHRCLAAIEGLLFADCPFARNGVRLWKTSSQVLHMYSGWAAQRSWTCFKCGFKASIWPNVRPQREHFVPLSKIWIARYFRRSRLSLVHPVKL